VIWREQFDREARARVATICDRALAPADRDAAWRELLIDIAPHVEEWASRSRTLRRCKLTGEDDIRGVLVEVMRRLAQHDFEALRAFVDQRPPTAADELDDTEVRAIEQVVRLLDDADEAPEPATDDTPFRAWLLKIVGYAAKDHVRARLGRAGEGTRRDVHTDASPLDAVPEAGERPPFTDLVTTRRVLEEIREVVATFPVPMQKALALWADDARFDTIASELALEHADRARDLVRAATARLRDRFRDRFPSLVSA
jgi:DNA-directed RNA polymerase specialized sigma24 family protein